jgi:hypothetical protein
MGHFEWVELGLFIFLAVIALVLLAQCRYRRKIVTSSEFKIAASRKNWHWRTIPETRLLIIALPLELLWEIAQFPLYTVWQEDSWSYILYGLAHCTLGDLIILLVAYWVVALINKDRNWYLNAVVANGFLFIILGAGYTIYSEIMNVRIKGTWGYTELMPVVPVIGVGAMPLLQWILIQPVLLWFMRLTNTTYDE